MNSNLSMMGDARLRWLGLRSYEESDTDIFYGRDRDSEKLFRMVRREVLTTVFAPSGTGKTSLLCAGLFPKLRKEKFLPVWVRLDHSDSVMDHGRYIIDRIEDAANVRGLEVASIVPPQVALDDEMFWEYMHRIELWDDQNNLVTPVVVLDQFEEVFTVGRSISKTNDFLCELADLVQKRIPKLLRERLQKDRKQLKIPFDTQTFRFVLAIRQDFVAQLDSLGKSMPAIMRNRYPLKQMSGSQAMKAVLGPGEGIVTETVARRIVEIAGGTAAGEPNNLPRDLQNVAVEPNHLSLVCHELNQSRIRSNESQITADGLEEQSQDILRRFYLESFDGLDTTAQVFVEENLLTSTGFRKSQPFDDAEMNGLTAEARKQLVNRHVLRASDRQGMSHIELTHDLLTGIVQESRDKRHEEEEKERLRSERQAARKRLQISAIACGFLLVFLCVAAFLAIRANEAEKIAAKHATAAEENAVAAEGLLSFMAIDMYDSLLPIGRLDLLDKVAKRAEEHLEYADSLTDDLSANRAKIRLANLQLRKGNLFRAIKTQKQAFDVLNSGNYLASSGNSPIEAGELVRLKIDHSDMHGQWGNPDRAIEILDTIKNVDLELKSKKYLVLCRVQRRLGDYANANSSFDIAMEACQSLVSKSSSDVGDGMSARSLGVELQLELGRMQIAQRKFPEAFDTLRQALTDIAILLKDDLGNTDWLLQRSSLLVELGSLHLAVGDPHGARDKLTTALEIAQQQAGIAATTELGAVLADNEKVKAENSYKPHWIRLLARTRNKLGEAAFMEAKYKSSDLQLDDALKHFERAIELLNQTPENVLDQLLLAETHANYGTLLMEFFGPKKNRSSRTAWIPEWSERQFAMAQGIYRRQLNSENSENASILLAYSELCKNASVASDRLESPIESDWYDEANAYLDKAIKKWPNWLVLYEYRAELLEEHAKWLHADGQVLTATDILEDALRCRQEVYNRGGKDTSTDSRIRALAIANWRYADYYTKWSDQKNEVLSKGLKLFRESERLFRLLKTEIDIGQGTREQWWVKDQLDAARAVFRASEMLAKMGKDQESLEVLENASKLGSSDATQALHDRNNLEVESSESKPELLPSSLAKRQESRTLLIPCELEDKLINNESIDAVTRVVLSPVTITGPLPNCEFKHSALRREMERLDKDLALKISDDLDRELRNWWKHLSKDASADVSLADLIENGVAGEDLVAESKNSIVLQYPRNLSTNIGDECKLQWTYQGSDHRRLYQIQVAREDANLKYNFEKPVIDKTFAGTSLTISSESNLPGTGNPRGKVNEVPLNSEFYWRVRSVDRDGVSGSKGTWSEVRKFGVYESLVKRIEVTKKFRIGLFEFDGDLLEWDESKTVPKGFNGELIKHIRKHLSEKYLGNDDLKIEQVAYSWRGLFKAASRADIDCAISIITRTKDRERQWGIRFSEPYYETRFALVSKKENPIRDIDALIETKARILVNDGFRAQAAAEMLTGPGNTVVPRTYQRVGLLINAVISGQGDDRGDAAITDYAFVEQFLNQNEEKREKLHIVPLKASDFEKALQREGTSETQQANLESMVNDYGGAEYEQYAVAMNPEADALRSAVNEAILDFRSTKATDACEAAKIPGAERLYRPAQVSEELASVIAQSPNQQQTRYVIGDEIKFKLYPILENPAQFHLQLSESKKFYSQHIIKSESNPTGDFVVSASKDGITEGVLYWRAKATLEETDLYPNQGWCEPVRFEFYKSCLSRIKMTKNIRIAVNVQNGQSVFRNEKGKRVGFDVQIIEMLCKDFEKKLGVDPLTPEYVEMSFGDFFENVENKIVDMAISGITKTQEREKDYEIIFSAPYCRTRQAAVWMRNKKYASPKALMGKRFIVTGRTRAWDFAKAFGEEGNIVVMEPRVLGPVPKEYLLKQLALEHADVAIMDYQAALAAQRKQEYSGNFVVHPINKSHLPESAFASVVDENGTVIDENGAVLDENDSILDEYGIALAASKNPDTKQPELTKGEEELRVLINESISNWKSKEGTLKTIFKEYLDDRGKPVFEVD